MLDQPTSDVKGHRQIIQKEENIQKESKASALSKSCHVNIDGLTEYLLSPVDRFTTPVSFLTGVDFDVTVGGMVFDETPLF